jgi:hypothetical protein
VAHFVQVCSFDYCSTPQNVVEPLLAGADLSVARDHLTSPESGAQMCEYMQHILTKLQRLPCITIAAIEVRANTRTH